MSICCPCARGCMVLGTAAAWIASPGLGESCVAKLLNGSAVLLPKYSAILPWWPAGGFANSILTPICMLASSCSTPSLRRHSAMHCGVMPPAPPLLAGAAGAGAGAGAPPMPPRP
eukprot:scaffold130096_cov60-Phaeocystis_antarctica.AAC.1